MRLSRDLMEELVFSDRLRHTQDSPVMPDVWFGLGDQPHEPIDVLLEPLRGVGPAALYQALRTAAEGHLGKSGKRSVDDLDIAYEQAHVVARVRLGELVRLVLPLSPYWRKHAGRLSGLKRQHVLRALRGKRVDGVDRRAVWLMRLVGTIEWARAHPRRRVYAKKRPGDSEIAQHVVELLAGIEAPREKEDGRGLVWAVNRNRKAEASIWASRQTIKADAAARIFDLRCDHLCWAVLDTGIDATHPAFVDRYANGELAVARDSGPRGALSRFSRVTRTYDFTGLRQLIAKGSRKRRVAKELAELKARVAAGRAIDWEILEPLLRVEHDDKYTPPGNSHGTHVAGILAGDWRVDDDPPAQSDHDLVGICPDMRLYDLRVLGEDGTGEEFAVVAAMQFLRYLNSTHRRPAVQGANVSLSIPHDVSNFACGRTPVCEEASRLVASGVVVVAAAGNEGYVQYLTRAGEKDAYRNISITDPGNADAVITVGATHRRRPHTYGVSYFSSRGPTGDGRVKPDVLAPGEKIKAPVLDNDAEMMDGTSMAAPHVSGAAALMLSRNPEFIGEPERIKTILCETATDLGRERYFQGHGLIDVARALQSV